MAVKKEDKKYGVTELAKYVKKSEATVRGALRKSKAKRTGKAYGWDTVTAMQAEAKRMGFAPKTTAAKKKKPPATASAADAA
jgi:hypothetical protein